MTDPLIGSLLRAAEGPRHELARPLGIGLVLEGDGAVLDRLGAAPGVQEQGRQVQSQGDVLR